MANRFLIPLRHLQVCVLIMLTAISGCADPSDSPLVALERARILIDRGHAAEAIPLITQAIDAMPEDAEARYLRGVAYESLLLPEKALEDYTECLKRNPERTDALNNKAVVLARLERFEEAAAQFSLLLERDPQDALAYRNRGLCRLDQQQYALALQDYDQAIALAPAEPANWFQRGNVFLEQEEYERAEADYSQAIEIDPDFARAWMNRGVARYQNGQRASAAEDLQRAQSLDDSIILPGLDFFSQASGSGPEFWNSVRVAAESELSRRGFREVKLVREYPAFQCAEYSARFVDQPRTVFVTCSSSDQADVLLPTSGSLASEAAVVSGTPASAAIALLILQSDPATNTISVRRFEDPWKPDTASMQPAILLHLGPEDQE